MTDQEEFDRYQGLFDLLAKEHDVTLTISEMDEVILESQKIVKENELLHSVSVSDSEIEFTTLHYEVVQKWFSEIMAKTTDKCLNEWLEVRR